MYCQPASNRVNVQVFSRFTLPFPSVNGEYLPENTKASGTETWALGKNEQRVVNAFETWSWRRILNKKFYILLALLSVFFYGSQNRVRLLLYTSLTDWFL